MPRLRQVSRSDDNPPLVTTMYDLLFGPGRNPVAEHLSDERILELTYITALYEMHAVMGRALRLEYDDRPEPIVEVVKDGVTSLDLGAAISAPPPA